MSIESIQHDAVPLQVARPDRPVTVAMIVLHQAPGYSPQIASWLTRLADHGYLAVAPMLLHRHGVEHVNPMQRFAGDLTAFAAWLPGDEDVLADVDSTLGFLGAAGIAVGKTGILGFSYGGRAAYLSAAERPLGAAITFYGNGIQRKSFHGNDRIPALTDRMKSLRTPWLGLYGDQDPLLTEGELDEWQAQLPDAPVTAELIRYPEAGHAFDVIESPVPGMPPRYVAAAAEDATDRTLRFLAATLH
ncbi:dienelactone hydrolase family protein [Nocardia alni]|uniref:dienelactone hydrolase family protein n=1 Tax=Nocardia alni TaxID=2815723 RepID=UPI001C2405F3|nr:dienelactone hydrolase family protein [Nocardia alni]